MNKRVATTPTLSDMQKTYLQVYLDVREFAAQLSRLGFDLETFAPLSALFDAVRDGEQVASQIAQ